MIDVIMDQCALCLANGLLDCVQLLRQIKAGAILGKHLDDAAEVTFGTLQPLDDIGVSFVNVIMGHRQHGIPPGGIKQA